MKLNPTLLTGAEDSVQFIVKKYYDIINKLSTIDYYGTIATDLDYKWVLPKYYKLDKFGNVTNNWCILYIGDISKYTSYKTLGNRVEVDFPFNISNRAAQDKNALAAITLYGISIDISASPTVIETRVKGTKGPVYQTFGSSNYDISLTFLESGPTFWQQNNKNISLLTYILNSGESINVINPQLNINYNISKAVCTGYNIGQDTRFYSHNNISITFKSDSVNQDILVPKKTT